MLNKLILTTGIQRRVRDPSLRNLQSSREESIYQLCDVGVQESSYASLVVMIQVREHIESVQQCLAHNMQHLSSHHYATGLMSHGRQTLCNTGIIQQTTGTILSEVGSGNVLQR